MGFSVSGATAVLFVGLLASAAIFVPAVDHYTEQRSDALTAYNEQVLTQQNTAVTVVNATYENATGDLTIRVRNTGASTLSVSTLTLVVDGEYRTLRQSAVQVEAVSTTDVWGPGETLSITLSEVSETPERMKLITGTGIAVTSDVEAI